MSVDSPYAPWISIFEEKNATHSCTLYDVMSLLFDQKWTGKSLKQKNVFPFMHIRVHIF